MSDKTIENIGGGGYGQKYFGISLTKRNIYNNTSNCKSIIIWLDNFTSKSSQGLCICRN